MSRVNKCRIIKGRPPKGRPRRRVIICGTVREFKEKILGLIEGRIKGPVEIVLP